MQHTYMNSSKHDRSYVVFMCIMYLALFWLICQGLYWLILGDKKEDKHDKAQAPHNDTDGNCYENHSFQIFSARTTRDGDTVRFLLSYSCPDLIYTYKNQKCLPHIYELPMSFDKIQRL